MTGRQFLERYGVTLAVVGLFALVIALLPGNASETASRLGDASGSSGLLDGTVDDLGTGSSTGGGASTSGGPTGSAGTIADTTPSGDGGAVSGDGIGAVTVGEGLCREDGRQYGISIYQTPCMSFEGFNGGATARGVTEDTIKVVRYLGQVDPATQAILEGAKLADSPQTRERAFNALNTYLNQHTQTYGRQVELIPYEASGPVDNDEASRADAVKIANDIGAFAVIVGTPDASVPKVMAQELAQRGVVCICTTSLSSQFYLENPPYIWGSLPTSTEYAVHIGEFIGKRLAGRNAEWAGDEFNATQGYRNLERAFGLIYIEGVRGRVDPEGKRARDLVVDELAKYGVQLAAEHAYTYDPGRNQQDVSAMIAAMRAAGVTTVITIVDPLYPILITQEATRQAYFPEWFITGTGLSDTTTAARLYDQAQWRHAYGISPLWVTWETTSLGPSYRMAHHGDPTMNDGDQGVLIEIYGPALDPLFRGIQMAGPVLTPDTLAQGMIDYPATGGKPGAPLVHYSREFPTAIKDFIEIWYDHDRSGPDERGEQGQGMIMKVDGGKRFQPGEWPSTNAKAFVDEGAVSVTDDPAGGGHPDHEQDGHTHEGDCMSCPGFQTTGGS